MKKFMPDNDSKDPSTISRSGGRLNGNIFFVVFFILLVLRILPGAYGNRMMGGVVWLLALAFFIWGILRRYGGPSKWFEPAGVWIQNNKVTTFFWFLSCDRAFYFLFEHPASYSAIWIYGD